MFDLITSVVDGLILTAIFLLMIVVVFATNKRYFLVPKNFPADIIAAVPPQTAAEKRAGRLLVTPFFVALFAFLLWSASRVAAAGFVPLYLHLLIVVSFPFFIDLIILDWLVLNTWTPKWAIFPGTEGFAGYKDYAFHSRAHLGGLLGLLIVSAIIAAIFTLLHVYVL